MGINQAENSLSSAFRRPYTVPDLSDKITRPSEGLCETGGPADVYRCYCSSDGGVKEVAVKVFRFKFSVKRRGKAMDRIARIIRQEVSIWNRMNHSNIVPLLGIAYGFGRDGNTSLVLPWMANGSLHTFMTDYGSRLTTAHGLQFLHDIASGLTYLHSIPVIHGDLSCNNVLLDDNYTARLVDYGVTSLLGEIPEALAYLQTTAQGTESVRWAAPEHFLAEDYKCTGKSDIYSLGNIAFYVLSGKIPWSEIRQDNTVMSRLSGGHKPARPKSRQIEDVHWALIEHCWSSLDQRPRANEVTSSLEQFLHSYPAPQPLRTFLSVCCPFTTDALFPPNAPFLEERAHQNIRHPDSKQQWIWQDLGSSDIGLHPGANATHKPLPEDKRNSSRPSRVTRYGVGRNQTHDSVS